MAKTDKKARAKMSDDDFQSLVFDEVTDARAYIDEFVSIEREQSTQYYKGRMPDVDPEDQNEDRSTAVMSEVRDTVLGLMPDLMRIFFSADGVVEYRAVPADEDSAEQFAEREQQAKQATSYINDVVLAQDNKESFITFHDAFQDGLVRKTGFIKWWWEISKKPVYTMHRGLDQDTLTMLAQADDIEIVEQRTYINQDQILGPRVLYDVRLKRIKDTGRARIQAVPCENVLVSRRARSLDRTPLFGYTEQKTVGDFIDMGLIDEIAELDDCDADPDEDSKPEAIARQPGEVSMIANTNPTSNDKSKRPVQYGEIYILADYDSDGVAELRRVITAGTKYKVLQNEPWDDVNFAAFCPYPEAHTFFGDSVADLTMDVQRIKSRILRDVLDSLAQSVKPQTTVVEGQVNLDDVLNPDTSNVIRQRQPGMVAPLVIPFVGKEALPILDLMTNVRENRTGQSEASQGLDPDVLQSTNQSAITATLSKAQSRVEMICRIFAETGMKRLFRGLLKLIVENQDQPRTVKLRGGLAHVDPASWDVGMDVQPVIPLGRGMPQDQIAFLVQIASKQEQILMMLGPQNGLVTINQYHYTLAKIIELGGWRNTESFITDPAKLAPEQRAAMEQTMAQATQQKSQPQGAGPAPPDPAVEMAKIQSNEKIKAAELQQKQAELELDLHKEQMRLQSNMEIEAMRQQFSRATALDQTHINAAVKQASDRLSGSVKLAVERMKSETAAAAAKAGAAERGTGNQN